MNPPKPPRFFHTAYADDFAPMDKPGVRYVCAPFTGIMWRLPLPWRKQRRRKK